MPQSLLAFWATLWLQLLGLMVQSFASWFRIPAYAVTSVSWAKAASPLTLHAIPRHTETCRTPVLKDCGGSGIWSWESPRGPSYLAVLQAHVGPSLQGPPGWATMNPDVLLFPFNPFNMLCFRISGQNSENRTQASAYFPHLSSLQSFPLLQKQQVICIS